MGTLNCAASGFAKMELERDNRRGKCKGQIIQYWYHMCLDIENLAKQCYQWQKSNLSVRSWTTELRKELHYIGMAFMWRNQQECNFTEMTKIVKNDVMLLNDKIFFPRCQRKAKTT